MAGDAGAPPWKQAAQGAGNLSKLELTLGEVEARFREAEQMQAERQPQFPLLYSLQGFRYCDLLLTEAERCEIRRQLALMSRLANLELANRCIDNGTRHRTLRNMNNLTVWSRPCLRR